MRESTCLKTGLLALLTLAASSCLRGPGLLKQSGSIQDTSTVLLGTTEVDGAVSGEYNPNVRGSQILEASAQSGISGASVLLPAGALSFPTTLTLEEGVSLANAAVATEIGLTSLGNAGAAVLVSAGTATNTDVAMTLSLPLPSLSALGLVYSLVSDPYEKMLVIYRVQDAVTGKFETGVIPRREVTVSEGKAIVITDRFGSFQTVIAPDDEVTERKKVEKTERVEILSVRTEKQLPQIPANLTIFPGPSAKVGVRTEVTVTGANFKEHVKIGLRNAGRFWEIKSDLNVARDGSKVSFYYPGGAPEDVGFEVVVVQSGQERVFPGPRFDKTPPAISSVTVTAVGGTNSPAYTNSPLTLVRAAHAYDVQITFSDFNRAGLTPAEMIVIGGDAAATLSGFNTPAAPTGVLTFRISDFQKNGPLEFVLKPGAAQDDAGNGNLPAPIAKFLVDNAAPTSSSISINNGSSHTNTTSATLTLGATGATHMYITNTAGCGSDGTYEAYATSKTWTLGQTNATATVYVKFKDAAGNESACISDTIIHDNLAPTSTSVLINGGTEETNSTSVTLTLAATGASHMYITNTAGCGSGGTYETYATSKTWTLGQANAIATVYVKFKDSAGNESPCINDTITHDNTPPNMASISINNGKSHTNTSSATLTLTATGASHMYITNTAACASDGTYETYATSKNSWTIGQINATATVYVKFKDSAGNESPCINDTIIHDSQVPTLPNISPASNKKFVDGFNVVVSGIESGAVLRYRDGTYGSTAGSKDPGDPTCSDTANESKSGTTNDGTFTIPIAAQSGVNAIDAVIKAAVCDAAGNASSVVSRTYLYAIPDVPTVTAVAGNRKVTVNWTPRDGAKEYIVAIVGMADTERTIPSTGVLSTEYTSLTNNQTYTFQVKAKNDIGASGAGSVTETPKGFEVTRPSQPAGFKLDWGAGNYLNVATYWKNNSVVVRSAYKKGLDPTSASDEITIPGLSEDYSVAASKLMSGNTSTKDRMFVASEGSSGRVAFTTLDIDPANGALTTPVTFDVLVPPGGSGSLKLPTVAVSADQSTVCVAAVYQNPPAAPTERKIVVSCQNPSFTTSPTPIWSGYPGGPGVYFANDITDLALTPALPSAVSAGSTGQFNLIAKDSGRNLYSWRFDRNKGAFATGKYPISEIVMAASSSLGLPSLSSVCTESAGVCRVNAIAEFDGTIYLGGRFQTSQTGNTTFLHLLRRKADWSDWEVVPFQPNGEVSTLIVDGNRLFIGGVLGVYKGELVGTGGNEGPTRKWSSMSGLSNVLGLATSPDGARLVAVGDFPGKVQWTDPRNNTPAWNEWSSGVGTILDSNSASCTGISPAKAVGFVGGDSTKIYLAGCAFTEAAITSLAGKGVVALTNFNPAFPIIFQRDANGHMYAAGTASNSAYNTSLVMRYSESSSQSVSSGLNETGIQALMVDVDKVYAATSNGVAIYNGSAWLNPDPLRSARLVTSNDRINVLFRSKLLPAKGLAVAGDFLSLNYSTNSVLATKALAIFGSESAGTFASASPYFAWVQQSLFPNFLQFVWKSTSTQLMEMPFDSSGSGWLSVSNGDTSTIVGSPRLGTTATHSNAYWMLSDGGGYKLWKKPTESTGQPTAIGSFYQPDFAVGAYGILTFNETGPVFSAP